LNGGGTKRKLRGGGRAEEEREKGIGGEKGFRGRAGKEEVAVPVPFRRDGKVGGKGKTEGGRGGGSRG